MRHSPSSRCPWPFPVKRIEGRHRFSTLAVCHVLIHPIALRLLLVAIAKLQNRSVSSQTIRPSGEHAASTSAEDAVAHGGQRRQLTVMFCDLVGSTALSARL